MPSRDRAKGLPGPHQLSHTVILVLLAFQACTTPDQNLRFQTRSQERQTGSCDTPAAPCARISIAFPEFTAAPTRAVKDSLNGLIERWMLRPFSAETAAGSVELLMEIFLNGYEATLRSFPDYQTRWTMRRQASVVNDTAGVLSLAFFESSFTGGAHPNSLLLYAAVDLRSGRTLDLSDVVREGRQERLNTLAESLFRRTKLLGKEDDLREAGYWFEEGRFHLNQNFALRKDGLAFYFNPYEVAPYALGPTELVIPYDSLREIVTLPGN